MIHSSYYELKFKKPAGTSRGILYTKPGWFLSKWSNGLEAIAECPIIPGLSIDDSDELNRLLINNSIRSIDEILDTSRVEIRKLPALRFCSEMLDSSLRSRDPFHHFDNAFSKGEKGIPINGLIWMGDKRSMMSQVREKLEAGYNCIKLKVGAIDHDEELELIRYLRHQFTPDDMEIRLDANGAYSHKIALEKLKQFAEFDIHSIEQPIKPGQIDLMAELCKSSPIDIALDEELIGVFGLDSKIYLIESINPSYLILKPSLLGGVKECEEWIEVAATRGIEWWATSALESNLGLNYIAQWLGSIEFVLPQGLGTGGLYENNIDSPLVVKDTALWYDPDLKWDISSLKWEE